MAINSAALDETAYDDVIVTRVVGEKEGTG